MISSLIGGTTNIFNQTSYVIVYIIQKLLDVRFDYIFPRKI